MIKTNKELTKLEKQAEYYDNIEIEEGFDITKAQFKKAKTNK